MKNKREYTAEEYTAVDRMNDDDLMAGIKERLLNLKKVERDIFLVYVNEGSYAAVAKKYNVSAPTAKSYINIIKNKLN